MFECWGGCGVFLPPVGVGGGGGVQNPEEVVCMVSTGLVGGRPSADIELLSLMVSVDMKQY